MAYYTSNAVYESLDRTSGHPFAWVSGNAWMLVYGDAAAVPRVMVLAHGKSWKTQASAVATFGKIAAAAGLPIARVAFDDTAQDVGDVRFADNLTGPATTVSLVELKAKFQAFGLPVKSGVCGKSVNDATSSAYHKWQRDNLGAIKVTDLDLVRLDGNETPTEILELKRSYYPLDRWKPFSDDFVNFNVLLAVARAAGLRFTIAYNLRQKHPFKDDASTLSLFDYSAANSPKHLGFAAFPDFVAGSY